MIKICYTFFLLLMGTSVMFAESDFSYDASQVQKTFSKLDKLEQMHFAQPSASLDELTSNSEFEGVSISAGTITMVSENNSLNLFWGILIGVGGCLVISAIVWFIVSSWSWI